MSETFKIDKENVVEYFKNFAKQKEKDDRRSKQIDNFKDEENTKLLDVLERIRYLYEIILKKVLLDLRSFYIHDDEKFNELKNILRSYVKNKIKSKSDGRMYIKINNEKEFDGDLSKYYEYFVNDKVLLEKMVRAITNELNSYLDGSLIDDSNKSIMYDIENSNLESVDAVISKILDSIDPEFFLELNNCNFGNFDKNFSLVATNLGLSDDRINSVLADLHANCPGSDVYQIELESKASEEAKEQGLQHVGFGNYADQSGQVVAKSIKGGQKLVDVSTNEGQEEADKHQQEKESREEQIKLNKIERSKLYKLADLDASTQKNERDQARVLGAKLFLLANNVKKDIVLSPEELKIANGLILSARTNSGRLYLDPQFSQHITMDLGEGSVISPSDIKNTIIKNLKKIQERNPGFKPRFKSGKLVVTTPPHLNHKATQFSPQNILKDAESFDSSEITGGEPTGDKLFGQKLDDNDKRGHVETIKKIVQATSKHVEHSDPRTKKYIQTFTDGILKDISGGLNSVESLANVRRNLNKRFVKAVECAAELNEEESRAFLKQYGELATYMKMLSQGQQVYMSTKKNKPIVDLIRVKNDKKVGMKIENISVKTKYGEDSNSSADSAVAMFSYISKGDAEAKQKLKTVNPLIKSSISSTHPSEIPEEHRQQVETIQRISSTDTLDEADTLLTENLKLSEKEIKSIRKRYQMLLKKYKLPADQFSDSNVIYSEIAYRHYMMKQLQESMLSLDKKIPLDFAYINVDSKNFDINVMNNVSTSQMVVKDKGFLGAPVKDEKGRVISIKYVHGNPGFLLKI